MESSQFTRLCSDFHALIVNTVTQLATHQSINMIAVKTSNPDFDQTYFTTYDLGLSAALVAVGFALDHLDNTDTRKVKFVFRRESGFDDVIQTFWGNNCKVDAQTYFNALKMLKNRIYSQ